MSAKVEGDGVVEDFGADVFAVSAGGRESSVRGCVLHVTCSSKRSSMDMSGVLVECEDMSVCISGSMRGAVAMSVISSCVFVLL